MDHTPGLGRATSVLRGGDCETKNGRCGQVGEGGPSGISVCMYSTRGTNSNTVTIDWLRIFYGCLTKKLDQQPWEFCDKDVTSVHRKGCNVYRMGYNYKSMH